MVIHEELRSDRLILKNLKTEDCNDSYLQWLNDTTVNQYLETRFQNQDLNSIKSFVQSINISSNSILWGIFVGDKHIGNIKLGPIHAEYKYADISYFIGNPQFWGNGYITEAIRIVVKYAFQTLKLRRVQAGVHATNIASIRALEKSGFILEGCFRNQIYHGLELNGFEDHLFYGLLCSEYKIK